MPNESDFELPAPLPSERRNLFGNYLRDGKLVGLSAIIFAFLLLAPLHASAFTEKELIGTWKLGTNLGLQMVTYSADHTFTVLMSGALNVTITGTWRLDGNEIITVSKTNPLYKEDVGREDREKITKLTGSVLETESPGQESSYERLK